MNNKSYVKENDYCHVLRNGIDPLFIWKYNFGNKEEDSSYECC